MLECPNCKNYRENIAFQSSGAYFTCANCQCRFNILETGKAHVLYKPLPHIIFVIIALSAAFSSVFLVDNKVYFQFFMCIAFFINIYYSFKVKIVYDTAKICLLSRELSFSEVIWAVGSIAISVGGFCIFSYALFHNLAY